MIPFDRVIQRVLVVISFLLPIAAAPAAFGQDDDVVDDAIAAPPAVMPPQMLPQVQFNPEQIDQWVFNRWGGASATKSRLEADLALRIDDLGRACSITEVQKKKLKLAGSGDIKRYYDRVDDLKRKYASSRNQANFNNNIWAEMQPLQVELNNGVFTEDSIFVKTVKSTLSAEQAERYADLSKRRAALRRQATVELFVVQIDKALGLSDLARGRMVELLLSETPPPGKYGQADYWYLMYQMSRLPESKVKAILDEPQWRILSRQFIQARGMAPWLRSNGLLALGEPQPTVGNAVPMRVFALPAVAPANGVPKK